MQFAIPISGASMPQPARHFLLIPVARADVPGTKDVHIHGLHFDRHVAIACGLHRCMGTLTTLSAFVLLCMQANGGFDSFEITCDMCNGAGERTRSGEVVGRERGLAADMHRGRFSGRRAAVGRTADDS